MRVEIIREHRLQAVNAMGPFVRVFAIGDVVDLPETHAHTMIAGGRARLAVTKQAKKAAPTAAAKQATEIEE